jgi:5-methylcytosine-specific restriction endonuclease McrA
MAADAAADADLDDLPPETSRALNRLAGGQLGRKPQKLTRRSRMPRTHAPKRRTRADALVTQAGWELMREVVFARAGHRCERCGKHRNQVRLDPHHRLPVGRGGPDALHNLAALCAECHEWVHDRAPLAATGLGYLVPSGADPAIRPMRLHGGRWVLLDDAGGYDLAA